MPAEQPRPEVREVEDESTIMHEVSLNGKIYKIKMTVGITIRYILYTFNYKNAREATGTEPSVLTPQQLNCKKRS